MNRSFQGLLTIFFLSLFPLFSMAQNDATIRGFVYEKASGEPVVYCNVIIEGTGIGTTTNLDGFFSMKVPAGTHRVVATFLGYNSITETVTVDKGRIASLKLLLVESSVQLGVVEVSAEREEAKTEVRTSVTKVTPKQIEQMPSIGGEPDLAQYLQVLPGVVFSGDQGGQLYIRGGTPVQNMVLLDGMVIYNPFHSIGFFSVFDTDILKAADIYSGGYNAEYGGRISSVMDVKTRDGNKQRLSGNVSASTFLTGVLLEGPLKKPSEDGGGLSFLVSAKHSYLDKSSKILYGYTGEDGLPFSFTDFYGKISSIGNTGSKFNLFGFSFNDNVNYDGITNINWNSYGFGSNFVLVPAMTDVLVSGDFSYSNYEIIQTESDGKPRRSQVDGFNFGLDFNYFLGGLKEIKYGIDILGFNTDFEYYNSLNRRVYQKQSTTELAFFFKYKWGNARWIIEPGMRIHYYASLSALSVEPRLGMKYNATEKLRLKMAGGLYSQNLIAANSDRDVVNLFYGFLSGSDNLPDEFRGQPVKDDLQRAWHLILGFEYDLPKNIDLNVEGYIKDFYQLSNINRNKLYDDVPSNYDKPEILRKDFIVERGVAMGIDLTLKYSKDRLYLWAVYSFLNVTREDELISYNPHFNRQHNVNLVASYKLGEKKDIELSARWNFGSGFPFTQTQGFYELMTFGGGINTDYVNNNGDLGIYYGNINEGQLPSYHRLDLSVKKDWKFQNKTSMDIIFSVTNAYNRQNIFYFNRVEYKRVDQLPILPSIGLTYRF